MQANNLTYHSFVDADINRYTYPGSKESRLFIPIAVARVSAFLCQFPEPPCLEGDTKKGQMTPAYTVECIIRKNSRVQGTQNFYHEHEAYLSFPLEGNTLCIFHDCKQICTLLQRETLLLAFKALYFTNILVKTIQNNGHSVPCLQGLQKYEKPMENCLTTDNPPRKRRNQNVFQFFGMSTQMRELQ